MRIGIIVPAYRLNFRKIKNILRNIETKKNTVEKIVLFVHKFRKSEIENIQSLKVKNLKILIEKKRKGKIGILRNSIGLFKNPSVIVVINGDIKIRKNSIKRLLLPYKNRSVGSTTGRGVVEGEYGSFVSYFNDIICELHHNVSKKKTKISQFYSFRHLPIIIPRDTVSDEAFFECMVRKFGLKNIYAEDAFFYYSAPTSISKVFEQRRRNFIGNLQVKTRYYYNVSTIFPFNELTIKTFLVFLFKSPLFMLISLTLEALARIKAMIDYFVLGEEPYKWKIVTN